MEEIKGGTMERIALEHMYIYNFCTFTFTICITDNQWDFAYEAGSSNPVTYDNLERWDGMGVGSEVQGGGVTCIPMADSYWYMAGTNTTL